MSGKKARDWSKFPQILGCQDLKESWNLTLGERLELIVWKDTREVPGGLGNGL